MANERKLINIESQLVKAKKDNHILEKKMTVTFEKNRKLMEQISKLKEHITLKAEQTVRLREQIDVLRTKVSLKSDHIEKLKEQVKKLRQQYHSMHASFVQLQAETNTVWVKHLNDKFEFANWVSEVWEDREIDVCIAHDSPSLQAAVDVKNKTGCSLVYDCVEFPDHRTGFSIAAEQFKEDTRGYKLVVDHEHKCYEQADVIFVGTETTLDWFRKNPKIVEGSFVQNCLDYQEVSRSTQILKDCGISENCKLIITPNTLHLWSYMEEFLHALSLLPDDVHFASMGTIAIKAKEMIVKKAKALGISNRVHFLPLVSPRDLIDYRSGAHIALIPLDPAIELYHHSKPNRLMESIMSRTPILTSNLKYAREIVEGEKCGECYETNDAKIIAKTISMILSNHDLYYRNTDLAAKKYCWKNERKTFIRNLENILDKSTPQNIVLIANKRLSTNRRNYRHIRTLVELGHKVIVYCLTPPVPFLSVQGVKYVSRNGEVDPTLPSAFYK